MEQEKTKWERLLDRILEKCVETNNKLTELRRQVASMSDRKLMKLYKVLPDGVNKNIVREELKNRRLI